MSKNNKIILIILISLIVLGLGYWFIYRPYAIKKSCFRDVWGLTQQKEWGIERFNSEYALCLKARNL